MLRYYEVCGLGDELTSVGLRALKGLAVRDGEVLLLDPAEVESGSPVFADSISESDLALLERHGLSAHDVLNASVRELTKLSGIGPATARRLKSLAQDAGSEIRVPYLRHVDPFSQQEPIEQPENGEAQEPGDTGQQE